jgi:hypothetical protein
VAKWEIVRRHDADPAQQGPLVMEIHDQVCPRVSVARSCKLPSVHNNLPVIAKPISVALQVRGHIVELAMSHTGSRVIQALVKLGTPEQREAIIQEVMPNLVTLSKSAYGHFFVVRLIAKATPNTLEGPAPPTTSRTAVN